MRKYLAILTMCILYFSVYGQSNSPSDLIQQLSEDILVPYATPLSTALGTAMGSGLYHRAKSHKFLGFDLTTKIMVVPIPDFADTHTYRVMTLTPNTAQQKLDTNYVNVTASTIFGDPNPTTVPVGANEVAVPPELPGGLDLPLVPFFVPQLSIGLPFGTEVILRFIQGPKLGGDFVGLIGFGLKYELTSLKALKMLPVKVALQGVYQTVRVGEFLNLTTVSLNLHTGRRIFILRPYAGIGFEKTTLKAKYDFTYDEPDPVTGQTVTKTIPIEMNIPGENNFRITIGLALEMFVMLHFDYNLGRYPSYNIGMGLTLR